MKRWFTFVLLTSGCAHVSSEALGAGQYQVSCRHAAGCYRQAAKDCGRNGFDVVDGGTEIRGAAVVGSAVVTTNRTTLLVQCRMPTTSVGVSRVAAR